MFFSPQVGVLYGSYDPPPKDTPGKFKAGTGSFEGMCSVLGALEYIEWVGETFGAKHSKRYVGKYTGQRC
jgi:hypothetical protein